MRDVTFFSTLASPAGNVMVEVDQTGALVRIIFGNEAGAGASRWRGTTAVLNPSRCMHVTRQLEEYFAGKRQRFELDLALDGTPFQLDIWHELEKIPYGKTISYGELARRAGHPGAARAAGSANGRNPIPIVIPCHRVIAADGSLGGYSAGTGIKQALLRLEGAL